MQRRSIPICMKPSRGQEGMLAKIRRSVRRKHENVIRRCTRIGCCFLRDGTVIIGLDKTEPVGFASLRRHARVGACRTTERKPLSVALAMRHDVLLQALLERIRRALPLSYIRIRKTAAMGREAGAATRLPGWTVPGAAGEPYGRIWISTAMAVIPDMQCGPRERVTAPSPTKLQAWSRTFVLFSFCDLSCIGRSKCEWRTRLVKSNK